jgi:hypothetical protein
MAYEPFSSGTSIVEIFWNWLALAAYKITRQYVNANLLKYSLLDILIFYKM